ncbi:MAG: ATP synthase F1 subunit epsilon [Candidatus Zipacnadales bacterium]
MANTFTLQIATPEHVVLEEEVTSAIVPAYDGYLGIKARHAPLVAELQTGTVEYVRVDGTRHLLACCGGLLAVSNNMATILTDAAEPAESIDIARAQAAEARARERLRQAAQSRGQQEVDVERARAALGRAINRIRTATKRL